MRELNKEEIESLNNLFLDIEILTSEFNIIIKKLQVKYNVFCPINITDGAFENGIYISNEELIEVNRLYKEKEIGLEEFKLLTFKLKKSCGVPVFAKLDEYFKWVLP